MLPPSYADEPLGSDGKAHPERQDTIVFGPRFAALVKSIGDVGRAPRAHQSCRDQTSQAEADQDDIAQRKAGEKAVRRKFPKSFPAATRPAPNPSRVMRHINS